MCMGGLGGAKKKSLLDYETFSLGTRIGEMGTSEASNSFREFMSYS